jgi:hypothetical protein
MRLEPSLSDFAISRQQALPKPPLADFHATAN